MPEPVKGPETAQDEPQRAPSRFLCSCIAWAREQGVAIPYNTDAVEMVSNTKAPVVGGLVLLKYPKASHVAVVTATTTRGVMIKEANYHHCQETVREVLYTDRALRGYWVPTSAATAQKG